jgi:cathepsin A (carboxypeptidase C)
MYSGYVSVNGVIEGTTPGGHLFFWLHLSEGSPEDPLVVWLNGGPGCSSLLGMVFECGPFTLGDDLSFRKNPHAWNKNANLLFIEQVGGLGWCLG